MYLSIGWLMVSWWPHLNLHRHNEGGNLQGLLYIDYGFHVPLMIAALILAYSFISIARSQISEGSPSVKGAAGGPDSIPLARCSSLTTDAARLLRGPHGAPFPVVALLSKAGSRPGEWLDWSRFARARFLLYRR